MLPIHSHHPQKKPFRLNLSTANVVTLVSAAFAAILMLIGTRHCFLYGYNYELECHKDTCVHQSSVISVPRTEFLKKNIVGAETVRVNGVSIVDGEPSSTDKAGYSFIVKYTYVDETNGNEEKIGSLLFTPHNLGKRIAKLRTHEVHDFAEGYLDRIRVIQGRHLTPAGGLLVFIGFLGLALITVLGSWPTVSLSLIGEIQRNDKFM